MAASIINPNSKTNYSLRLATAGGSLVILAGIVVILAANRIVPSGTNAISKLGIWGQIAGYGTGAGGVLIIAIPGVKNHLKNQPIKGTIYIHSLSSGPIRKDHRFVFSERIKNEEEFISIEEDDLYLELSGSFKSGKDKEFLYKDKNGVPTALLYFPFSLFKDAKEGTWVRFYYDDRLVELECRQNICPNPKFDCNFEQALDAVKEECLLKHNQFLWEEDVEGEAHFMKVAAGQSHVVSDGQTRERRSLENFTFYREDQQNHGSYELLKLCSLGTDSFEFPIYKNWVNLNEIHVIESFGFNELRQVWLVIPHKPEENQFPATANTLTVHEGHWIENQASNATTMKTELKLKWDAGIQYTKESFDPKKGARLARYHYGQFFPFTLRSLEAKINLNFNANDRLELSVD